MQSGIGKYAEISVMVLCDHQAQAVVVLWRISDIAWLGKLDAHAGRSSVNFARRIWAATCCSACVGQVLGLAVCSAPAEIYRGGAAAVLASRSKAPFCALV